LGHLQTITKDHPDIKELFESPSKIKSDHALATAGRANADAAVPLTGLFAEFGLTTTFFADMRSQADSIESHAALQNAGGANVDANAGLEVTLGEMDDVVERLATVVTNKYRGDPAKLAAWESASHLERAPRPKPEDDDGPPPTPPPANG
jgi:hypothetical protein